jgi:hypothetical protein
MSWNWRYLDGKGKIMSTPSPAVRDGFLTRADAETWLGDTWRDLLDDGVRAVTLLEDEREVYGPMSLEDVD